MHQRTEEFPKRARSGTLLTLDDFVVEGAEHGSCARVNSAVEINAAAGTDWFFRPNSRRQTETPRLVAQVDSDQFIFRAKVAVGFRSTFDAGALFVEVSSAQWAKLAFEYSRQLRPTIVSVVTKDTSDDSDGPVMDRAYVHLRISGDSDVFAFHFSDDGKRWTFLRVFALPNGAARPTKIGLTAQSPTGRGCVASFSGIALTFDRIDDIRSGV